MEGELGEDRGLGSSIVTVDVERWIGLEVAERICLGEDGVVVGVLLVHLREHVVRRAVHDAEHLRDAIASERLAQRPDERDRPGHGCLEVEVDAVSRRRRIQGGAIGGEERLVGGHDARAGFHGREDERSGIVDAAHDLDHDVGAARGKGHRVVGEERRIDAGAIPAEVADGDPGEANGRSHPRAEVVSGLGEQPRDLRAHGATADERNGDDAVGIRRSQGHVAKPLRCAGAQANRMTGECREWPQAPGSRARRSSRVSRRSTVEHTPSRTEITAGRGR